MWHLIFCNAFCSGTIHILWYIIICEMLFVVTRANLQCNVLVKIDLDIFNILDVLYMLDILDTLALWYIWYKYLYRIFIYNSDLMYLIYLTYLIYLIYLTELIYYLALGTERLLESGIFHRQADRHNNISTDVKINKLNQYCYC